MFSLNRLGLVAGTIGALALPPAASADQRPTDGLNPSPPPFLSCKGAGAGTICSGHRQRVKDPEDTGITCGDGDGAFNIYDQGAEDQRLTLSYDGGGNLERARNHERWAPASWSNPLTGAAVPYTQSNIITTVFAVPGDFDSATETTVGEVIFTDPETGSKVLRSVGRAVISPVDGTLLFRAGVQPFLDAFVDGDMSVLDDLCAALAS